MSDALSNLTAQQCDELRRIAEAGRVPSSAVPVFLQQVQRVIARFTAQDAPQAADQSGDALAAALEWRDAALGRIADEAARLFQDLTELRRRQEAWNFPDRLGPELARFNDPTTGARLDAMEPGAAKAWLWEQGPARMEETLEALAHLADAAREASWMMPSAGPGRPVKYDSLLDGLEAAVCDACAPVGEPAEADWEAAWHWTSAKGPFGRLVGLALEAAGEPPHSNLYKLIAAWLKRSQAAFAEELAASADCAADTAMDGDPADPA